MKIKTIMLIFLSLLIFGCTEKNSNTDSDENNLETPEILENDKDAYSLSSFSKRYDSSIIEKLYEEALDKNKELKKLHENIELINNDSLNLKTKAYKRYTEINNRYWKDVYGYVNNINDSLLKNSTIEIFKKLELSYRNRISEHESKMNDLDNRVSRLNDEIILMKLLLTEPMISNYQRNELPDINSIETIINDYDKLIKDAKQFSQIRK